MKPFTIGQKLYAVGQNMNCDYVVTTGILNELKDKPPHYDCVMKSGGILIWSNTKDWFATRKEAAAEVEKEKAARAARIEAAKAKPKPQLPARFTKERIGDRPAVKITDTETGRTVNVGFCDLLGAQKVLIAFFGPEAATLAPEEERNIDGQSTFVVPAT